MKKINTHLKNINAVTTVCCLDSVYSLLLYFLIKPAPMSDTLFIFGKGITPKIYEKFDNYIIVNHPFSRLKIYLYRVYFFYYFKKLFKKYRLEQCPKYGHDFLRWTDFFLTTEAPFYLIEDGLSNYTCPQFQDKKYGKRIFRILTDNIPMLNLHYGLSDNVKKIYLTGIEKIPNLITKKVEIVNIKNLWNSKTDAEKESILDIYSVSHDLVVKLNDSDCNVLLLTQCLSEDNLMSEQEKIELYKDAVKDYEINKVIIKTHPREKTNYSNYFNDALIINERFPVQLLFLLGLKIETVITYHSSGIYTLPNDVEKVIIHPIKIE